MKTQVLYARIREDTHAYLVNLADVSGLPISRVVDAILDEAMRRGWHVEPRPSLIVDDRKRQES